MAREIIKASDLSKVELSTRLKRIGNDVASLWGASCYDYTILYKEKRVNFDCIECGEEFLTHLSFSDIKSKYGLAL